MTMSSISPFGGFDIDFGLVQEFSEYSEVVDRDFFWRALEIIHARTVDVYIEKNKK